MKSAVFPLGMKQRSIMCKEAVKDVNDEFQIPYEIVSPIITGATQFKLLKDVWNNYPYYYL